MWETAISLLSHFNSDFNTVSNFYKNVCGLFKKDENSQHFDRVVESLGGIQAQVERLSDTILYAPSLQAVQDMGKTRTQQISNLRDVRELLEPVQRAIGTEILSSAVILTPERMQQALVKDPWEVLCDIRPVNLFKTDKLPPEGVPVLFEHEGLRYLGWQLRGTLPILFNCRYDELWVPESGKRTPPIISPASVHVPETVKKTPPMTSSASVRVPKSVKKTPPIISSASAPANFVVSPSGKYSTINAALRQAKAGDRIMVQTGLYRENLVIQKNIELIAEGSTVIESSGNCIWMRADSAVVRGFTLQGRAKEEDQRAAVSVPYGQLVLEHCDITSNSLACVEVRGKGSHVILRNCKIHDSSGAGVFIYNQATGQLEDCDIFGNANAGVQISEGGDPVIRRCQIHDGKSGGVFVSENSNCRLMNCDIFGNARPGVEISTGGNPVIRQCKIHHGKSFGVLVLDNGRGTLEGCGIFGNANAGVLIKEGGNPVIRQCIIKNNAYEAIWVLDNGRGTVEDCDLRGNQHGAWNIDSTSQVQRRGNKE